MFDAIGYIRFPKGTNGSPAMEVHQDLLRALCERHNIAVKRVVEENGVADSTPLDDRATLLEAIEAIRKGEAHVLAVADANQLAGSETDLQRIIQKVREADGHLVIEGEFVC